MTDLPDFSSVREYNKKLIYPKLLPVDCDDTLVCHDLSEYPDIKPIEISFAGYKLKTIPNQYNVNTLVKLAKLGYNVCLQSNSGADWAVAVANALNISEYIACYAGTSHGFFIDDNPAEWRWNRRINRDANTGVDVVKEYG